MKKLMNEWKKFLAEKDEKVELIKISDLERGPRKTIGRQGTSAENMRHLLNKALPELDTSSLVDAFSEIKTNPEYQERLTDFVRSDPIKVNFLGDLDPDFPYEVTDGHHRATILQQSGIKEIPAIVKPI